MRYKSLLAVSALCLGLLTSTAIPSIAFASDSSTEDQSYSAKTVTNPIRFQGIDFVLLDTFANPDLALQEYASSYFTVLNNIKNKNSFPELSTETATIYKNALISEIDNGNSNLFPLIDFLDIYENFSENTEIIDQLNSLNEEVDSGETTQEEAIALARMILPTKSENKNDKPVYQTRNSGINLSAARDYAVKWATRINSRYGEAKRLGFFSADCTNFASQILLAGGVKMDTYKSKHKGWWWKSKTNRSVSWINAHVFKNYMGSGYKTRYWRDLVRNVRSGDFIALDKTNDGTIDHIGFIHTKKGNDLRIIQHSIHYNDWNGGWPGFSGKGMYYRVRR